MALLASRASGRGGRAGRAALFGVASQEDPYFYIKRQIIEVGHFI